MSSCAFQSNPSFNFNAVHSQEDDMLILLMIPTFLLLASCFVLFCFFLFSLLLLDLAIQGNTLLLFIKFDFIAGEGSPVY